MLRAKFVPTKNKFLMCFSRVEVMICNVKINTEQSKNVKSTLVKLWRERYFRVQRIDPFSSWLRFQRLTQKR